MTRRSYRQPRRTYRRRRKDLLNVRAPRKGTLIIACVFYIVGACGALGWYPVPEALIIPALAIAGGLLILGALLRDL